MYAVNVESFGSFGLIVPAGNSGIQKLRNRSLKGWMKETECMRKNSGGTVYVVRDFTQKMCEMSAKQLANYIIENHVAVLPR